MQASAEGVTGGTDLEPEPTVRNVAAKVGASLLIIIALAVDELNPVKILCNYTRSLMRERDVAVGAFLILCWLCYHERAQLLYNCIRLFFRCTLNNMFFQSVEMVGLENLPKDGPVILTGNHNNQFVDGIILLTNCNRHISFMIAQKSFERPLIGFLARAFHCIPVSRAQDMSFQGAGKVRLKSASVLVGQETNFTKEVKPGAQLQLPDRETPVKVKEVLSDCELSVEAEVADVPDNEAPWQSYKVVPKLDQSAMYQKVYSALEGGKCLGIFPEGGSHDRTDLLPLKAGVAIIALEVFSKCHIHVPIVPVGLNYFQGHKFGGRAVVEFGAPIDIPEDIYALNETDKYSAREAVLQLVQAGMRSVIVPTPDYNTLQLIYMARRLYVGDGRRMSAEETNDLNRRFAVGVQKLLLLSMASGDNPQQEPLSPGSDARPEEQLEGSRPTPASRAGASTKPTFLRRASSSPGLTLEQLKPEEINMLENMRAEMQDYADTLKRLGIRDHQVRQIGWWSLEDMVGRLLYLVVAIGVAAMPQLLFNLPVMSIAGRLALAEQQKALRASSVKLAARDVLMSYKIIYCLVCIPILYVIYTMILFVIFRLTLTSVILWCIAAPAFAFLGMKASEQGVRNYRNLVPLLKRVTQQVRQEQDALPARRQALRRRLQSAVRAFGPRLGELYTAKRGEVNWNEQMAEMEALKLMSPGGLPISPSTNGKRSSISFLSRSHSSPSMERLVEGAEKKRSLSGGDHKKEA